jgi:hypothetical protein
LGTTKRERGRSPGSRRADAPAQGGKPGTQAPVASRVPRAAMSGITRAPCGFSAAMNLDACKSTGKEAYCVKRQTRKCQQLPLLIVAQEVSRNSRVRCRTASVSWRTWAGGFGVGSGSGVLKWRIPARHRLGQGSIVTDRPTHSYATTCPPQLPYDTRLTYNLTTRGIELLLNEISSFSSSFTLVPTELNLGPGELGFEKRY